MTRADASPGPWIDGRAYDWSFDAGTLPISDFRGLDSCKCSEAEICPACQASNALLRHLETSH